MSLSSLYTQEEKREGSSPSFASEHSRVCIVWVPVVLCQSLTGALQQQSYSDTVAKLHLFGYAAELATDYVKVPENWGVEARKMTDSGKYKGLILCGIVSFLDLSFLVVVLFLVLCMYFLSLIVVFSPLCTVLSLFLSYLFRCPVLVT